MRKTLGFVAVAAVVMASSAAFAGYSYTREGVEYFMVESMEELVAVGFDKRLPDEPQETDTVILTGKVNRNVGLSPVGWAVGDKYKLAGENVEAHVFVIQGHMHVLGPGKAEVSWAFGAPCSTKRVRDFITPAEGVTVNGDGSCTFASKAYFEVDDNHFDWVKNADGKTIPDEVKEGELVTVKFNDGYQHDFDAALAASKAPEKTAEEEPEPKVNPAPDANPEPTPITTSGGSGCNAGAGTAALILLPLFFVKKR